MPEWLLIRSSVGAQFIFPTAVAQSCPIPVVAKRYTDLVGLTMTIYLSSISSPGEGGGGYLMFISTRFCIPIGVHTPVLLKGK